jgi:hypothetical protein
MPSRFSHVVIFLVLMMSLGGVRSSAQAGPASGLPEGAYCGGVVTTQPPSPDLYVISGPEPELKTIWTQGNLVYINRGASQGVKIGDEFLVSRPETDPIPLPWFTGQMILMKAMGTYYVDLGRIRVTTVQAKVSVAQIIHSCDFIQRGDVVEPFQQRPGPEIRPAGAFDRFAPSNGKPKATIVFTQRFGQVSGMGTIVYANLGSAQGVKVGDYFRVFREVGTTRENLYQVSTDPFKVWGFGSTPQPYGPDDLPREVIGEGVVTRVGPNAATILLTGSSRGIYGGDYVELE